MIIHQEYNNISNLIKNIIHITIVQINFILPPLCEVKHNDIICREVD